MANLKPIHASAIKYGRKSMLAMRAFIDGTIGHEETPAKTLGTLAHMAILEPDRFAGECVVYDGGGTRASKDYKEFAAAHDGARILKADEMSRVVSIRDAVMHCIPAAELIVSCEHEVKVAWEDPAYGPAAGRIDLLGDFVLADLKTAANIEPRSFTRQAFGMGYFHQLAWYRYAAPRTTVKIVAVESSPPHDVAIYTVPGMYLDVFYRQAASIAARYRECEATGYFPGAVEVEQELDIEPWMLDGEGAADGLDEIEAAGL